MAILNLYSKRQKSQSEGIIDVFTYDEIPEKLINQTILIIRDFIGKPCRNRESKDYPEVIFSIVYDALCREYGLLKLTEKKHVYYVDRIMDYLSTCYDAEKFLDLVELLFREASRIIKSEELDYLDYTQVSMTPDEAISDLCVRFRENGIGYTYIEGSIIRIDSTYLHSEITKPILSLLHNDKFLGANEEYLKAHEFYRQGKNKECLSECLKAFESTIKIICSEKGWEYKDSDTSAKLIQHCLSNGLIPDYLKTQFASWNDLLGSGITKIRNRLSGHGQGSTPKIADDIITRYGLHLTGTNIYFLIEQSGI
jgi:hypothetical protein